MPKNRIRIDPRNHLFKTAGTLTGLIFLGGFGLVFGLIGGTLIDQLVKQLRNRNMLKTFSSDPEFIRFKEDSAEKKSFIEASAVSVAFYLCFNDPAKIELVSAVSGKYFPEAPGNTAECLLAHRHPDFSGLAAFFGRNAAVIQKVNLLRLIVSTGLKPLIMKVLIDDPEGKAAQIIASADFLTYGSILSDTEGTEETRAADFALLGLEPNASKDEIKRVYHNLAGHFHPDSGSQLSPEQQKISEEAFKRVKEAYERLKQGTP